MRTPSLADIRELTEIALDSFDDDIPDIGMDSDLYRDVGLDSMGGVALAIEIQRRFKVRIPEELAPELRTPRQLIDYIVSQAVKASSS